MTEQEKTAHYQYCNRIYLDTINHIRVVLHEVPDLYVADAEDYREALIEIDRLIDQAENALLGLNDKKKYNKKQGEQ